MFPHTPDWSRQISLEKAKPWLGLDCCQMIVALPCAAICAGLRIVDNSGYFGEPGIFVDACLEQRVLTLGIVSGYPLALRNQLQGLLRVPQESLHVRVDIRKVSMW